MLFSWLVLLSATALTPPAKRSFSQLCTDFAKDPMNNLKVAPLQLTVTSVGLLAPVLRYNRWSLLVHTHLHSSAVQRRLVWCRYAFVQVCSIPKPVVRVG